MTEPLPDTDLHEFERRISEHLSPLDAAITGPLVEGHDATQPLVLLSADHGKGTGCVLIDAEGLFPIAWAAEPAGLTTIIRKCKMSVVLLPASIAEPTLLEALDLANVRFITDAPPTRDEAWRCIRPLGRDRWWTNDGAASEPSLVKIARRMELLVSASREVWNSLFTDRPITRPDQAGALDRHLSLVAATSLGTIAWELWRGREATTPLLTLQRFHDLDARVSFSRDLVRVKVAMGRRHQDLRDHGFLEDVRDVPWFGGRILQFAGG